MLTWSQVVAFRLARHHLAGRPPANVAAVARGACGMQAQVLSAAYLALWARQHRLTPAQIAAALWNDRSLVKTSAMRGTLHLLAADDLSMYLSALRSTRMRQMRKVMARSGVTSGEAEAVKDAVVHALRAGPRTRGELTASILAMRFLGTKARKWFVRSWWGVVRQAIVEGEICYGPDRGPEATFIRLDQWLPKFKRMDEHQAGRLLLRRFLASFGPATPRDFAKWTGMSAPEVRAIWDSLAGELLELSVEGTKSWLLREDYNQLIRSKLDGPVLRLLPNFDSFLLAHAEKKHLVDRVYYKRVFRNAGWVSPVVLLNGRAVGTWTLIRKGKAGRVEVQMFSTPSKPLRSGIEGEVASLARFLETPLRPSFI